MNPEEIHQSGLQLMADEIVNSPLMQETLMHLEDNRKPPPTALANVAFATHAAHLFSALTILPLRVNRTGWERIA